MAHIPPGRSASRRPLSVTLPDAGVRLALYRLHVLRHRVRHRGTISTAGSSPPFPILFVGIPRPKLRGREPSRSPAARRYLIRNHGSACLVTVDLSPVWGLIRGWQADTTCPGRLVSSGVKCHGDTPEFHRIGQPLDGLSIPVCGGHVIIIYSPRPPACRALSSRSSSIPPSHDGRCHDTSDQHVCSHIVRGQSTARPEGRRRREVLASFFLHPTESRRVAIRWTSTYRPELWVKIVMRFRHNLVTWGGGTMQARLHEGVVPPTGVCLDLSRRAYAASRSLGF